MTSRDLIDTMGRYPLVPVAVKAAVAAALAWTVVQPLGGAPADYAYYAPLGAVVVVSSRLGQSLHATLESVVAIAFGAVLAVAARLAPLPDVVAIGLVVGVGTLLGAWRKVGSMASWVPISALFILIVGGPHPLRYVASYLGLVAVGAAVGVVVNMLAPPLPMVATRNMQRSLRDVLAEQLDRLADGLESDPLPTRDEWRDGEKELARRTKHAEDLVSQLLEASQLNWRVRRQRETAQRQLRQGRALSQLTFLVQDMTTLLSHQEHADLSRVALGEQLRPPAAEAFRAAAAALRSVEASGAGEDEVAEAERATDALADAIKAYDGDGEVFSAGGLVTAIRRVLASIASEGSHGSG